VGLSITMSWLYSYHTLWNVCCITSFIVREKSKSDKKKIKRDYLSALFGYILVF